MGNIFAIRPGENNDLPPIAMGSHLDTQVLTSQALFTLISLTHW